MPSIEVERKEHNIEQGTATSPERPSRLEERARGKSSVKCS